MLQPRQHSDFTNESHFTDVRALIDVQNLQSDLALVPGVVREINCGEGSLSDLTPDFVSAGQRSPKWSNRVARGERICHLVSSPGRPPGPGSGRHFETAPRWCHRLDR